MVIAVCIYPGASSSQPELAWQITTENRASQLGHLQVCPLTVTTLSFKFIAVIFQSRKAAAQRIRELPFFFALHREVSAQNPISPIMIQCPVRSKRDVRDKSRQTLTPRCRLYARHGLLLCKNLIPPNILLGCAAYPHKNHGSTGAIFGQRACGLFLFRTPISKPGSRRVKIIAKRKKL